MTVVIDNQPRMAFLQMIADPVRNSMINLFLEREYCTATQIIEKLNLKGKETLISYHLKCLKDCGLLLSRRSVKDKRQIEYFLHNKDLLLSIFSLVDGFTYDHIICKDHQACQVIPTTPDLS